MKFTFDTKKFTFDTKVNPDIENWIYNHPCMVKDSGGVSGRITFSFTPTIQGVIEIVSCKCGAELNVTRFENELE